MPIGVDALKETKKGEILTYSVSSAVVGTLEAKRVVIRDASGTNDRAIKYGVDDTVAYIGITTESGVALDNVTVQNSGVAIGLSGGAIAFGASVKATTAGKLIAGVSGDACIGTAEQATAGADEEFGVRISYHTIP